MPYDDPDPTDPMTLQGIVIETDDPGPQREMAVCFVEEYLRMGFDPHEVLKLFQTPEYVGPFMACRELGEEAIRRIIDEQAEIRGLHRPGRTPNRETGKDISLRVLES